MEREIAEILLRKDAVSLRPEKPFKYASGILSPIYCDNRILMSHVKERTKIINSFIKLIRKHSLDIDVVAGTESAGIPWAAWVADRIRMPMIFVRKKVKEHGKEKRIEGYLARARNVVVIEDLVSTGGSSLASVNAVKEAGAEVVACLAIFTYELHVAKKNFAEEKCPLYALTDFITLVKVAVEKGYIREEEEKLVLDWNKSPDKWGR